MYPKENWEHGSSGRVFARAAHENSMPTSSAFCFAAVLTSSSLSSLFLSHSPPTPLTLLRPDQQIANALGAGPARAPAARAPKLASQQPMMSSTTQAHLTSTRFEQLPISPLTKRALHEVLGYETCTEVQAAAVPPALQGKDLVCKAKTGTGKTLGFLIPAYEALLARPVAKGSKIGILVVSPTRELATQIAVEAEALAKFHSSFNGVLSVVGG